MPPRFAYWTILIDDRPTAFRAQDQQELLPTVNQLKRKNQNVVMKWFAQGKLWNSPEAQRAAGRRPKFTGEKRGGDWRPGGTHKDPRDRFKKKNRPERTWSEGDPDARRDREKLGPRSDVGRGFSPAKGGSRPWRDKPVGPARGDRPWSPKPDGPPHGAPSSDRPWQTKPSGPRSERKPWRDKPAGPPRGDRPWSGKPRDNSGTRRAGVAQVFRPAGGNKPSWRDRPRDPNRKPFRPVGPPARNKSPDDNPRKRRDDKPPDRD
jgi:hypothetical protein